MSLRICILLIAFYSLICLLEFALFLDPFRDYFLHYAFFQISFQSLISLLEYTFLIDPFRASLLHYNMHSSRVLTAQSLLTNLSKNINTLKSENTPREYFLYNQSKVFFITKAYDVYFASLSFILSVHCTLLLY